MAEGASNPPERSIAVYPGSFDPITNGHLDILERAARLFDRVVVAIGQHPSKPGYFPVEQRCQLVTDSVVHLGNVEVAAFSGLVVNFCRERGARVIVRGLRAVGDFEQEFQMGLANRDLASSIETVFLIPSAQNMFISSSLIREIAGHRGRFESYVPAAVAEALRKRIEARE